MACLERNNLQKSIRAPHNKSVVKNPQTMFSLQIQVPITLTIGSWDSISFIVKNVLSVEIIIPQVRRLLASGDYNHYESGENRQN